MYRSSQKSDFSSPRIVTKKEAFSKPDIRVTEDLPQMEHLHLEEASSSHKRPRMLDVKREVTEEPVAPMIVKEEIEYLYELSPQSTEDPVAENLNSEPVQITEADELEQHDVHYMTGNYPYSDVVLAKSHVSHPYQLQLPAKLARMLPPAKVPVVIRCERRNWDLSYIGNSTAKRFDSSTWKSFVFGHDLNIGDVCVFELIKQSNPITFKVIIIRGELPPEIDSLGTEENPIVFIE